LAEETLLSIITKLIKAGIEISLPTMFSCCTEISKVKKLQAWLQLALLRKISK